MDEVVGRPGPVALQFGHLDAPWDVPMVSLSLYHSIPKILIINNEKPSSAFLTIQIPRLFSSADQPKAACPTAGGGELHENVSGK